jgi:hypothetical protein
MSPQGGKAIYLPYLGIGWNSENVIFTIGLIVGEYIIKIKK